MPINLNAHNSILTGNLTSNGLNRLCSNRMLKGVDVYERPGFMDQRDYLWEAIEELSDAANYLAMEIIKNGDSVENRNIFTAICEAYRGISLLRKRNRRANDNIRFNDKA